ncbi:MAG: response regulator transcription factor [Acutalibacteraceae bacterium]|nr:response regulator transcription factor [Clostridia bacterium]MEE1292299.1 response regulator transcription factor [Acutalibacteraceae bacterium]NLD29095.1 response regulator transcription factor [Clostridiales bacterium]MBQ1314116.1 response regulator transcription factor [Clostridia bacterium]MBQ5579692.1 response regulator transcription factor [Clostridia bacterium]
MKKILVAEDESAIREFIVINLKRSGYDVTEAADGAEAVRLFDEADGDFDVCLLDIMMPEMDGIEVCKELRKRSSTVGIIILTAKTEEIDKVTGLLVGADDYVTKPFSPAELMARVDALYRRVEMVSAAPEQPQSTITLGEFTLDVRSRTLTKNGNPIELTQVEFQIMEYFFNNPGAALSRTDILQQVWGSSYFGEEKIVDVNIRRLRMKVEDVPSSPQHLMTIWGIGYKWVN